MMILALFFAIVFGVATLASFAGWIWLVVRGFGKSAGWGLAMLFFSPVASIVGAVRDWSEWKRPFLLYYGSFGAQIVVVVVSLVVVPLASPFGRLSGASAEETEPTIHKVASTEAPEGNGDAPAPAESGSEIATGNTGDEATEPINPADAVRVDPTGRPAVASMSEQAVDPTLVARGDDTESAVPDGYEEIAVATASTRVGARIRIVARDGRIHKGTLADVEDGRLHVNFEVSGGSVAMDFATGEIRSLQVRR